MAAWRYEISLRVLKNICEIHTSYIIRFFLLNKFMNGQVFYYPGFQRIFVLIVTDGSRRSRVNGARSAEGKK